MNWLKNVLNRLGLTCECNKCFHNCGVWCDFESHCKKKFMESDRKTDKRIAKGENK